VSHRASSAAGMKTPSVAHTCRCTWWFSAEPKRCKKEMAPSRGWAAAGAAASIVTAAAALSSRSRFVPDCGGFVPSAPVSSLPVPDSSHSGFFGFSASDRAVEPAGEMSVVYPRQRSLLVLPFARLPRVVFMVGVAALLGALSVPARAQVTIDMVTVGDPGNTADTTGDPNPAGAVADSFQIMKFEFTNQQYTDFLNSVAATDTYSLYNTRMGSNARGGITQSGASGSYTYAIRTNMGDKPVNYVSWFDAARVANWLMNGATGTSSMETGAYTLNNATSGNAPAVNSGATFYIPTENQWYKAAYYKGSGTNAGYWDYATQSDLAPTAVTSGSTGIGSSGSAGNFANYNNGNDWNSQDGNVTTVGTNGGASAYGAFDMSGNVWEWNDLTGAAGSTRGFRGGRFTSDAFSLSSSASNTFGPSYETAVSGIRLVPEPSTWVMGLAGIACGGYSMFRRRKQA